MDENTFNKATAKRDYGKKTVTILRLVMVDGMPVSDVADSFNVSRAYVSRKMNELRALVDCEPLNNALDQVLADKNHPKHQRRLAIAALQKAGFAINGDTKDD